jgi:hypothetical protein
MCIRGLKSKKSRQKIRYIFGDAKKTNFWQYTDKIYVLLYYYL